METGDVQGLLDVVAPDVTLVAGGGGIRTAAVRRILGADKVTRFLFGSLGKVGGSVTVESTSVNGNPALVVALDGELDGILAAKVEDGRIAVIHYVRNPEKLERIAAETPLDVR